MDISRRKALILLCRAQATPDWNSTTKLAQQTYGVLPSTLNPAEYADVRGFAEAVQSLDFAITHPIYSSLILDLAKSCPLSSTEIIKARDESWYKEIMLCEGPPRDRLFDYRCWFYNEHRGTPLLPGQQPRPEMADLIRANLQLWRTRMRNSLIFPRMSTKLMSRDTVRLYNLRSDFEVDTRESGSELNQVELERFYHDTGVHVQGVCEIRQKWYRHGLKPRTYYAQGGTTYHSSKYLQEAFNDLVDTLSSTNHELRLMPMRLILDDEEYCRIYDLTGFSSNHNEQKFFLEELSKFCEGTPVQLVDSYAGVIPADLGQLISDYLHSNTKPEYSRERVPGRLRDQENGFQNVASFLGVYGNLMTCTFPHGASLVYAVGSPHKVNVAGDDGHFSQKPGLEQQVTPYIEANGLVERSKEFDTREEGAVCLKRGLFQESTLLFQKPMIIWPSLTIISDYFKDVRHAAQFGYSHKTRFQKRCSVATEVMRFLQSIFYNQVQDDYSEVKRFLDALYREVNFPVYGQVPQLSHCEPFVPRLPQSSQEFLACPIKATVKFHYVDSVVLPQDASEYEEERPSFSHGDVWYGSRTRWVGYLEKLAYLQTDVERQLFTGEHGREVLVKEYFGRRKRRYRIEVLSDVPVEFHYV